MKSNINGLQQIRLNQHIIILVLLLDCIIIMGLCVRTLFVVVVAVNEYYMNKFIYLLIFLFEDVKEKRLKFSPRVHVKL